MSSSDQFSGPTRSPKSINNLFLLCGFAPRALAWENSRVGIAKTPVLMLQFPDTRSSTC